MSKTTVSIAVPGGIVGHGKHYTEIQLREPTWREYFDRGEVVEYITYPSGMRIATINNETVHSYLACCLVEPKDPLLLEQADLKVAKEVRSAIINFIHGDTSEAEPSQTSPGTSSGAAKDASPPPM